MACLMIARPEPPVSPASQPPAAAPLRREPAEAPRHPRGGGTIRRGTSNGLSPRRRSVAAAQHFLLLLPRVRSTPSAGPAPTALTTTAATLSIERRRSRRSSRTVSAPRQRGRARHDHEARSRRVGQQRPQPAEPLRQPQQRLRPGRRRPTTGWYFSRIAISALHPVVHSAGISSSRSACPVGAVSITTRSRPTPAGRRSSASVTSSIAASSSRPGGARSIRLLHHARSWPASTRPLRPAAIEQSVDRVGVAAREAAANAAPASSSRTRRFGGPPGSRRGLVGDGAPSTSAERVRRVGRQQQHALAVGGRAAPIAAAAAQVVLPTPPFPPNSTRARCRPERPRPHRRSRQPCAMTAVARRTAPRPISGSSGGVVVNARPSRAQRAQAPRLRSGRGQGRNGPGPRDRPARARRNASLLERRRPSHQPHGCGGAGVSRLTMMPIDRDACSLQRATARPRVSSTAIGSGSVTHDDARPLRDRAAARRARAPVPSISSIERVRRIRRPRAAQRLDHDAVLRLHAVEHQRQPPRASPASPACAGVSGRRGVDDDAVVAAGCRRARRSRGARRSRRCPAATAAAAARRRRRSSQVPRSAIASSVARRSASQRASAARRRFRRRRERRGATRTAAGPRVRAAAQRVAERRRRIGRDDERRARRRARRAAPSAAAQVVLPTPPLPPTNWKSGTA